MPEATGSQTFEEIVRWAYSSLPQEIKDLPDFPGIQVADEPPANVLQEIQKKRDWPVGRELLDLYSGVHRTQQQHNLLRIAPDLIFVFRGPILRCSKGDLRAEVKRVVWHEVAHWLGHNEAEVKELGLSGIQGAAYERPESEAPIEAPVAVSGLVLDEEKEQEANEPLRCIKCYSTDITCRKVEKPLSYAGANPFDPTTIHARRYTCNSCGSQWDDEDIT